MTTGKVWGTTESVLLTPLFELHRLTIKPNSRCSMHKHRMKHNGFTVISGRLFVDVEKNDYPLTDTTLLKPGETTTVAPGEYHCFRTGAAGCVAVEFYYVAPLADDIKRKDHGGRTI
jgi:mannose-6-phosphate isomerase-like protein (cupin superfamily)